MSPVAVPPAPPSAAGVPGAPDVVPPASVPLGFLGAAGVGLVGAGLATALAADRAVVTPTHSGVVAAVHVTVLAFLTTAVLGALHQFVPVISRRPLRSVRAARVTLVGMVLTGWLLPTGFTHGPEALVAAAGVLGAATVALAAWNLSGPLASPDGGLPARGVRIAVAYLLLTVAFGVVYAFDRQTGWFPLLPTRVLAHAHLGLLGWLGLAYVSVAGKLWPMFLLAHRPSARSGSAAVGLLAAGPVVVAGGLLLEVPTVAWAGGLLVGGGIAAHLVSLAGCVRHRRRPLELLHAFLFASAAFVVVAGVLAVMAAVPATGSEVRVRLVAAEVAALVGWLGLAVAGHVHKIVPFIGYSALRARGVRTNAAGTPLLFSDLFDRTAARMSLGAGAGGFALVVTGLVVGSSTTVAVGALAVAACGTITTLNLATGPRRATAEPARPVAPTPGTHAHALGRSRP